MRKKKSNLLFHFTPKLENIKGILEDGFKLHFSEKYVQYKKKQDGKDEDYYSYDVYPIVSFCNINLSSVLEQTKNYGNYGIAMSKKWADKNALNPIIYFTANSPLGKSLGNTATEGFTTFDNSFETLNNSMFLTSFLKNHYGKSIKGKLIKNFNNSIEKEWCYVPKFKDSLQQEISDFEKYYPKNFKENAINKANKGIEKFTLKFKPKDVKYIIIEKYDDVLVLVEFLKQIFKKESVYEMMTKIITIEQLSKDF